MASCSTQPLAVAGATPQPRIVTVPGSASMGHNTDLAAGRVSSSAAKAIAQFKRHLSQTSSTPFGASSQPSAQLYEHAHALPSGKAALASQVRTSPVGNGGAHGNGGSGGGGNGGGGAPPVIAKSYSVAAPHVGEA